MLVVTFRRPKSLREDEGIWLYTVLLTMPALALYYIYEKGFTIDRNDLKYIIKGILKALVLVVLVFSIIMIMGHGHFGVSSQISNGFS